MGTVVRPTSRRPGLRYLPAVDGLRTLAVAAVFAYHAGLGWAGGGFIGVDVFFVISGFLITAVLLNELESSGNLNLLGFWGRRARRLLPALFTLLAATAVAVPLLAPDQGARLQGDLLAALLYVTNWRLIFEHQSYFQAIGRPPILQHLWTLAIEEQFYLLWPIVLSALLVWRRKPLRLVLPILGAAGVSAGLMALLYDPSTLTSAVYYGTETRLGTILVGAALACVWAPNRLNPDGGGRARPVLEIGGLAALAGLAWVVVRTNQFSTGLYHGGFLLVALLSAVLVAAASHPAARSFGRVLGWRPMAEMGKRSYAIYLWHWPVIDLTRPRVDVALHGPPLLVLRIALTLALAELSYRLVERPALDGRLGRAWGRALAALSARRRLQTADALAAAGTGLVALAIVTGVVVSHQALRPPSFLRSQAAAAAETPPPPTTLTVTTDPGVPPTVAPRRVTAVGDSVLLDGRAALHDRVPNLYVDAQVGRPFQTAVSIVHDLRVTGRLGDEVIIHMGTNNLIRSTDLAKMMAELQHVRRVVLVNVKADRPWEGPDNSALADAARHYPNTVLVDWHHFGTDHPDLFYGDGIHMTPFGANVYAQLIAEAL
jgi:peptidoglycan/LPS O-acetylase OafA/YrhL